MRETLAHVTFKRAFLRALRKHVAPGGALCVSDFVQMKEAGPKEWGALLDSLGVTHLASPRRLLADFDRAGLRVLPGVDHDPGPLLAFFANRSKRLVPGSEIAGRVPFESLSWARDLLNHVIDAAQKGILGWVRLVATADVEPTEPSYDEPAEHALPGSSVIPPEPQMARRRPGSR